jgi:hypothetical protein
VIVHFVDIDKIVDHHCLRLSFHRISHTTFNPVIVIIEMTEQVKIIEC